MTAGTHTAAELAARAGMPVAKLQREIADADHRPPAGPNRATRRAVAKQARKAR
ncbi:MAG: hypothetical protein JWN67_5048 [Actinomycetia bacterium]|nr:hypothetical protein [Actinomycetes bacterium]